MKSKHLLNGKKFLTSPNIESCKKLKNVAEQLELSQEQLKQIEKEIEKLPPGMLYAVRSSSPEEDLEGTSFAGIYESNQIYGNSL